MDSNQEQLDDFSVKALLETIKNWLSFLLSKSNDIIKFSSYKDGLKILRKYKIKI